MAMTVDQVAEEMYQELVEAQKFGKKLKPMDLTKNMLKLHEDEGVDKKMTKAAIKQLVDSGKAVYTYFGGSFIELPHREGAAND